MSIMGESKKKCKMFQEAKSDLSTQQRSMKDGR
jgi:hypothetical protein